MLFPELRKHMKYGFMAAAVFFILIFVVVKVV